MKGFNEYNATSISTGTYSVFNMRLVFFGIYKFSEPSKFEWTLQNTFVDMSAPLLGVTWKVEGEKHLVNKDDNCDIKC